MCLFDPLCGINLLRGGFLFNLLDRMEFFSFFFLFWKSLFCKGIEIVWLQIYFIVRILRRFSNANDYMYIVLFLISFLALIF